jgi:hypothetical protein
MAIIPIMKCLGSRATVIMGCMSSAIFMILFGFVLSILGLSWDGPETGDESNENTTELLGLFLSLWFMMGVMSAFAETGILVCVSVQFKNHGMGKALAGVESAAAIANVFGQLLGGFLYTAGEAVFGKEGAGALAMPTLVLGSLTGLIGLLLTTSFFDGLFCNNNGENEMSEILQLRHVFKKHWMIMTWVISSVMVSLYTWAGVEAMIAVQLHKIYGLSPGAIGIALFTIPAVVYFLLLFPVGMLMDLWTEEKDANEHQVHLTGAQNGNELLSLDNSSTFDNVPDPTRESRRANSKQNLTSLLALGFIFYAIDMSILGPHVKQWVLVADLLIVGAGISLSLVPTLFCCSNGQGNHQKMWMQGSLLYGMARII